ncbi:MAG: nuclear transport factor 2 family protein [bacterium]
MDAREVAQTFFDRVGARDVDGALSLVAPDAEVHLLPVKVEGTMAKEGRQYLEALITAFPDLYVKVRSLFVGTDGTAVAEITVDGVQAADFLGILNQEKHMDVDQVWLLHVNDSGLIDRVRAYWCQNQVYRRLAVKRLDRITITT